MKNTKAILDSLLPEMSPSQQKSMLRTLAREADRDSRKQAALDPISKIPMA